MVQVEGLQSQRFWPRLALTALAAVFMAGPAMAQINLKTGPLIRLADRQVNFGTISEAATRSHEFVFWNDGTEPLVIEKVESSCGCTAAAPTDSSLAPGARSSVRVSFEAKDLNGEITKAIAVYTNDPAEPRIDLVLRANVVPLVSFETERLDFGDVPLGESPTLSTLVTANTDAEFSILRMEGGEDYVDFEVIPASSPDGEAYLIQAQLKADAPIGRFNQRIVVFVDHPETDRVRMGVRGTVYTCFIPAEGGIRFGSIDGSKRIARKLRIERLNDAPYEITGVESILPFVNASVSPDGDDYVLTVEVDGTKADYDRKGFRQFKEYLRLITTDPRNEDILVQIRGVVRR